MKWLDTIYRADRKDKPREDWFLPLLAFFFVLAVAATFVGLSVLL